uniref:C3H1-type domain-containing protein n=1 Tax=Meloidogyne javanica TaxID=6303 RepID=A0A915M7R1_MELJA
MYSEIEEGEYIDEEDVDTEQIEKEQMSTNLRKMSKNRKQIKSPQIEEDDNDDDEVLRQKLLENLVKSQTRKQLTESSEGSIQSPKRKSSQNNKLSILISQLDSTHKKRDSCLSRRREIQSVAKQQKKQQKQNLKNEIKKILPENERTTPISRLPIPTRKRKNLLDNNSTNRKIARIINEGEDLDLRELIPSKAVDKNISPSNIPLEEGEIAENDESFEGEENVVNEKIKENKNTNQVNEDILKENEVLIEMDKNTTSIVPEFSENLEEQDVRKESPSPPTLLPPSLPLMNIRLYRLSPNFPQHLLSHPAFSSNLNPFIPLCPFQLNGRCADKHCVFQHEQDYILNEKEIVEEFLSYWPKLVPKGMGNSDYATKMLAEGPLDQVLGFLMASMPDDVRICLNLFSGKYFEYSRQADKQIIRDDQIEYEQTIKGAVGQPKGWLSICIVAVFVYLCYRRYMNGEKTILVNTELTLSSEGENNG